MGPDLQPSTSLTPSERGFYAKQLLRMFEPEVRARGGNISLFARKLGRTVGLADAVNVQNAVLMPTLKTALAVLSGQPVDSPSVKTSLKASANGMNPTLIGSSIADTTYTPLPNGRCRVADSRVAPATLLPGLTVRGIDTEDTSSYASQGGTGSSAGDGSVNCGIPSFATALVVSVTALTVGNVGFLKIFENGKSYTEGNTVFFTASTSASNDVIVTSCQACALELSVYASTPVHYVLDVIGFYMPPQATAVECVTTAETSVAVAASGGQQNATAPACAAGYTQTATNCKGNWNLPIVFSAGGTCSAQNNGLVSETLRASRTCCRVPGR